MPFKHTFPTSNKVLKMTENGRICLGSATFLGKYINEISYMDVKQENYLFFLDYSNQAARRE